MTPPTTPRPATDHGKVAFENLTDQLLHSVSKHVRAVIVAVVLMLALGRGRPPGLKVRGLLLAGILSSAVGLLDDFAVGQASTALELKRANPMLGWGQVFRPSMVIGRDQIASRMNTLRLAYVAAALPLSLLLGTQSLSLTRTLNGRFKPRRSSGHWSAASA